MHKCASQEPNGLLGGTSAITIVTTRFNESLNPASPTSPERLASTCHVENTRS